MKKQLLSLAIVSTLSLGSLVSPLPFKSASASKISELKEQKQEIINQSSNLKEEAQQKKTKIGELQNEQDQVKEEIKRIDFKVSDTELKIEEKNIQIQETNAAIEKLKAEVLVLQDRIAKRNEMLKEKARSFQENGGTVSYMDVLLGAQSFGDFVDRVNAVATFVEADKSILEQHRLDKVELETKQAQVETKLANLQVMKKDLEGLKVKLNGQIAEKTKLMNSLKKEEKQVEGEMLEAAEQADILAAQASALQQAIKLEQQRQAEAAAAAAAERARQAAELARQRAAQSSNSGGNSAPEPTVQAAPPVSNGAFMMPANGRLTSGIGERWGSFHAGIDIANSASGVPIVAAADGVVIRSYYSSSYGNAIFVAHSINGQTYTTVYAHMSNRSVGSGEVVSKGQRIGTMGNTGQSYGQHLHFELHRGSWNASKSNAINPLSMM